MLFDPPAMDYHICPSCKKIKLMWPPDPSNPYPWLCKECWYAIADPKTGRVQKIRNK